MPRGSAVDAGVLRSFPLPDASATTEKHERGTVLVIGGTHRTPGAVRLAGLAALRVGAGKLQLVTDESVCGPLAIAVPEALVAPFSDVGELIERADAVLCGPGMFAGDHSEVVLKEVVAALRPATALVIDAGALAALGAAPALVDGDIAGRCVLTPNPGELAALLGSDLTLIDADPDAALRDAVARFGAVVTLRGAAALTAAPGSPLLADSRGNAGLGTSGSGDVAVGAIAGLLARGASPLAAAVWGNHLHRRAGEQCAARIGPVGYLASDLLEDLPGALRRANA